MTRLLVWPMIAAAAAIAADETAVVLKTASNHPMQYYLSLPRGWSAKKTWPVVVVIESANREFKTLAESYANARADRPFILITPMVTTNGGPRYREAPGYRYTDAVWTEIERIGRCTFDMDGLAAIVSDVHRLYGGDSNYYLTGLEAAGHTIYPVLFRHPDALLAVAPVATNYGGRCMEDGQFHAAVPDLPVKIFAGARDAMWKPGGPIYVQSQQAKEVAVQHGYRNVSETVVAGKDHEPLPDEVLSFFYEDWKRRAK